MKTQLLPFLAGEKEKVGFVLKNGDIVELANICDNPVEGFVIKADDMLKYEDQVVATWHTHPKASANLSVGDYLSFRNYPKLRHYIVGTDGVFEYAVRGKAVVVVD